MKKNRVTGKANIYMLLLSLCTLAFLGLYVLKDSTSVNDEQTDIIEQIEPDSIATVSVPTKPSLARSQATEEDDSELYLNREMQAQVLQVADLYEQNAKYPVYSIPVVGERFAEPVKPFEEAEVDSVYPQDTDKEGAPLRVAASVERLRYFEGEQIIARLIVSGGSVVDYSQVNATGSIVALADGRTIGLATTFEPFGGAGLEFRAAFDTRSLANGQMPNEAMVKATVFIDGENLAVQTVPFYFNSSTAALLENVMPARIDGAFMRIPLAYSVQQTGYYFVDAFLDDATTGQALIQLKTEGPMNQGNGLLTLSAHISALKDAGSEGPYRLRIAKSFLAGVPGQSRDLPVRISQQAGYNIDAVPFSQYEDTPFSDPEVQERIDFLREVGNSNSQQNSNETEDSTSEQEPSL